MSLLSPTVQPKRDFDMTWFKGTCLAPSARARRIRDAIMCAEKAISVDQISIISGLDRDDVVQLTRLATGRGELREILSGDITCYELIG